MALASSPSRWRMFVAGGHTTQFLGKGHPSFIHPKHPEFGKKHNPSWRDYMQESVVGAVKDAFGLPDDDPGALDAACAQVDRLYVGNFAGELFVQQGHLGPALVGVSKQFQYKPAMRIEGACASGGLALAAAVDALQAGQGTDIALVAGVEVQSTVSAREGGTFLARAADFDRQAKIDDFAFPCLLARRAKAYLDKYPRATGMASLNPFVEKAYRNGNLNPKAHMHKVQVSSEALNLDDKNPCFLSNDDYKSFVRMRDCSQVSDGGSCLVLCNEKGAEKLRGGVKENLVELCGIEYGCGNLYQDPDDLAKMDTAAAVVGRLLKRTGVLNPKEEVDVFEVHDCFSIAEVLMYEAIGLTKPGEALAEEVAATVGKKVNTGGGLLSFGHPVGATGVKQVHECYRQIRGQSGDYQLAGEVNRGLAVNMGGDDKTIVATLLQKL
ncbi:unnamed protein product [Amoebophrya sp. A120]|nr:unnamed protein product [Amoebophrya sp. A120]|eukprot:GSA120T00016575001.1